MTRFEEEYQVRLAMAISASDPAGRVDPDSVQIRAAERISLGCGGAGASGSGDRSPMEILSLRYWNHNMVNYDEKLMDGFYDVYGVLSDPSLQTKFPSLVNLRSMPPTEDVKYVAISVNRILDPALQQLERKAAAIAVQSKAEHGVAASAELVQKIANLVVNAMGGPVEDADDMNGKWTAKSSELCFSLNSFVLPLGSLEIGLSRHRSLLFKVLADRVNLPCKLVKGIYYTGTDEGAINLVKFDFDSTEYIVDLMGAPGTLIPSEISSSQLQDSNCGQLSSDAIDESVAELCLALEHIGAGYENENVVVEGSSSENSSVLGVAALQLKNRSHTENTLQQIVPCDEGQFNVFNIEDDIRPAQQMKVNDISKFLAPEANDPQFAQKLHTVLLERSASPLPDLFSSLNSDKSHEKGEMNKYTSEDNETSQWLGVAQTNQNLLNGFASETALPYVENTKPLKDVSYQVFPSASYEDVQHSAENVEAVTGNLDLHGHAAYTLSNEDQRIAEDSMANMSGNGLKNSEILVCSGMETINSAVDDIAEYEIPWEDLQIGERIGIGSYGEVYHADWHGTEVAVKKFLDQDFSGVALEQFKYEVKIMSRLRHPNVVLFMGSVTQPPNLSILTEYLPRGSLYRLLHRPHCQIDETRRLKMALDVAKGMNYLHTSHPTIVHRDLKSPNLLVDKNWVVKVSDFGLSRLKHHTFLSSKSTAGTPEWMAPEVLRNEPSNEKCDVYSFGVILWELATLRMPWGGLNPMQVVGAVGFQNRRLDMPKEVDPLVASIISSCWESDPSKRPSFSQLLSPLKELQRLVAGESY